MSMDIHAAVMQLVKEKSKHRESNGRCQKAVPQPETGTAVLISLKAESSDPYERAFIEVMEELKAIQLKEDIDGWVSYIERNHPDLDKKMDILEERFSDIWQEGLRGKTVIEKFRATLKEWRELKLNAIEIFKNKAQFEQLCLW